jgi:XTP/dITP diphosphohydrolase
MRVYAATNNAGKLKELRDLFQPFGWEVVTFDGYVAPTEGDTSYQENAALKACALYAQLMAAAVAGSVVADDSGLEVATLAGRPGVLSARYGSEDTPWPVRRRLLLDEVARSQAPAPSVEASTGRIESFESVRRRARFVCAMHFIGANGLEVTSEGTVNGEIATSERGEHGFGYDPLFYYPPLGKTFAELTEEEKNAISHRAHAARNLATRVSFWAEQSPP